MKAVFAKESDLCQAFISVLPEGWTAYPETGGFDIVLSRAVDGFQIGVEAKLKLNAKVICQAAERISYHYIDRPGPDCRAVLVPEGVSTDFRGVCSLLGITVIRMREAASYTPFYPCLPKLNDGYYMDDWQQCAPVSRLELPDWVPDVRAGESAPTALTDWKIRAIKIVITLERRGFVTRQDFAFFKISMSRWTQEKWLVQDGHGGWVAGQYTPDFRAQHPVNFPQIEADFEKWRNPAEMTRPGMQGALL